MSARPILWGTGAGLLLAALLAPWTGTALGDLARARATRSAAAAALAAPVVPTPPVRPDLAFPASGGPRVAQQRVERLARGGGVLVEAIAPLETQAPLMALSLRVSGPEKAVLALADAIERERPLLRFRSWRIEPAEGGGVRLSGVLAGATR